MDAIYLGNWSGREGLIEAFEIKEQDLEGLDILLAWYGYGSYDGDCFVLARDSKGQLLSVVACHCSCWGLEGQWEPEVTTLEALRTSVLEGHRGSSSYDEEDLFASELEKLINRLGGEE